MIELITIALIVFIGFQSWLFYKERDKLQTLLLERKTPKEKKAEDKNIMLELKKEEEDKAQLESLVDPYTVDPDALIKAAEKEQVLPDIEREI